EGERAVRFYARDIHHFAWTASPDYRYEGGMYRDTIALGVLYEPRGAAGWGHGVMLEKQRRTLAWLESLYGLYAYPQVIGTQRLDPGATEFPMMVMYGSAGPSWGLVLHEVGHIYTYGILANNEWRSGWMDEGLTDYQSDWAQGLTLPERAAGLGPKDPPPPAGYRGKAHRPPRWQQDYIDLFQLDLEGRAEPIGTPGQDFNEFTIYNLSVYSRASMMYGALRNVLGDSLFRAFLRDYYARWKLKHVDEAAMRASAERVSGRALGWFFDEWVHHTGLVDYRLEGDSAVKVAGYTQPMPVVTANGVKQIDPLHVTPDWDSRNDGEPSPTTWTFGWPFLDQWDRYRNVAEIQPMVWYTNPGGMTFGARVTSNYQRLVDRWDVGLAMAVRGPESSAWSQLQGWAVVDDPKIPWTGRPVIGLREGLWMVDGTFRYELRMKWDESPFKYANGERDTITVALNVTSPYDRAWQDTLRWSDATVADVSASWSWRAAHPSNWFVRGTVDAGIAFARGNAPWQGAFGTATLEGGTTAPLTANGRLQLALRGFGALSSAAPPQNSVGLSTRSPLETFTDNYLRGQGAVLVLPDVPYLQLGGAGLRGYTLYARVVNGASLNTQLAYTVVIGRPGTLVPRVQGALFGDGAYASLAGADSSSGTWIGDAGVSAILRGALYDRAYVLRIDFPVWLSNPELAPGRQAGDARVKLRWTFTVGDLW
ncbi:MAG TPA: M1 family aminopeptidase, partial [Gemmatimonadaceae bacterium]|nr:M1 family aminopeptidase [Gemmatimonadaceae bacterium]